MHPPTTYTGIKSFVGLVGHYRRFIKGFAQIAAPLYDLISGDNSGKKKESVQLTPEVENAFQVLKEACLQAPILSFPDFTKPFLLETDASGKGLGAVLSQKQEDGRYHPITYASWVMTATEQRYHSNKKEFLALKWAVTEQFHEYLYPYQNNKMEFVVRTDNNPLTYIFSSASLDAAGQCWVGKLADYNFSLEYQKGKDNTVADFLSRVEDRLPPSEVEECLATIPQPGVKAILDNAVKPIKSRAEAGTQPLQTALAEVLEARPARLSTVHVTDWKKAQKEDPVLYQVVKNLKAPREQFKEALRPLIEKKSVRDYVKMKDHLVLKDGLLYLKTYEGKAKEVLFRFVVPKAHRSKALDGCHREAAHQGQKHSLSLLSEHFWWPGMSRELVKHVKMCPRCRKFEVAPPKAKLQPLPCSGPGEILHIDFTSIEESVDLQEVPAICNVLVIQDHFSKYVVAYVVKDQMAATTTHTLRHGYFALFGVPAYLVSDQGKAFVSQIMKDLCKLYGVQKLRTSPYHAQTNGQVERMNQTIIRMIGKLGEDEKARWSEHLPELLSAYNATCLAVTGYSPYYLLFGRRPRIPVDFQFPTHRDPPSHYLHGAVGGHYAGKAEGSLRGCQATHE